MILQNIKLIIEKILEENSYKKQFYLKNFPSFSITTDEFLNSCVQYSNEYIKNLFSNPNFVINNFDIEFTFDDLINVEQRKKSNLSLSENQILLDHILQNDLEYLIRNQKNLSFLSLISEGIKNSLEERVQYSLTNILLIQSLFLNNPSHSKYSEELIYHSEKMASTLIIINNIYPQLYKEWQNSLSKPFKNIFLQLQDLIENPSLNIKKEIYLSDPFVFEKIYPNESIKIKEIINN